LRSIAERVSPRRWDWSKQEGDRGFTIVELLIVMIISLIILAGMAGVIDMAYGFFRSHNNVQAVNDSSRRVLASMARQLRCTLHFVDASNREDDEPYTDDKRLVFYADISGTTGSTIDNWEDAEKVEFYLNEETDEMMQRTTSPGGSTQESVLGSYVDDVTFMYFDPGVRPAWDEDLKQYTNAYVGGEQNKSVGMVKIFLKMKKDKVGRSFEHDVFLRVLVREPVRE